MFYFFRFLHYRIHFHITPSIPSLPSLPPPRPYTHSRTPIFFTYIKKTNKSDFLGLALSLNRAMDSITTPYVAFVDASAVIAPTFIEKAVWFLRAHDHVDVVETFVV
jgi:hypothetical protein